MVKKKGRQHLNDYMVMMCVKTNSSIRANYIWKTPEKAMSRRVQAVS